MDAPLYRPANVFVMPERRPEPVNTRDLSLRSLLAIPQAKAILFEEIPHLERIVTSEQMKPHLGNFSPRTLGDSGHISGEALDRADKRLAKLPAGVFSE